MLMTLVEEHERNTGEKVETVVADRQYGTVENFRACYERGIRSHMGDFLSAQVKQERYAGIYGEEAFVYDTQTDSYTCPAGQILTLRKHKTKRKAFEYACSAAICRACPLRGRCTKAIGTARSIKRHVHHEAVMAAKAQSHSAEARKDRVKRKWLMEGSFADAANNHGFKRSRWRLLWRQQIQDYLIAAIQNVRILLRHAGKKPKAAIRAIGEGFAAIISSLPSITMPCTPCFHVMKQSLRCFQPENIPVQHYLLIGLFFM